MTRFGERLRKLRLNREMSQIELANALSLSNSTISQYEANRRTPDPPILQRLADYFGVSVDYLLGRTDDPHLYKREAKDKVPISDSAVIEKRNEKGPTTDRRTVPTQAAHRTDDYDEELPEEAIRELEAYKEYLRHKYRKKKE